MIERPFPVVPYDGQGSSFVFKKLQINGELLLYKNKNSKKQEKIK